MKSPMKKNIVSHSTLFKTSFGSLFARTTKITAPESAIIARPLFIKLFKINPARTRENIIAASFK